MTLQSGPSPLKLIKGTESFPLDADAQRFVESISQLPSDLKSFRSDLVGLQMPDLYEADVDTTFIQPAFEDATQNPFRLVRPRTEETLPLLLYFHGGGWSPGKPHSHDRWLRQLAVEARMAVASLDDALPEDGGMQIRIERAEAVIRELKYHAGNLRIDPSRNAFAGDSMGAHFAVLACLQVYGKRISQPAALILICPLIIGARDSLSRDRFGSGPWLTMDVVRAMLAHPSLTTKETSSAPMPFTEKRHLDGAPTTVVITAEYDPLCDEGEDAARALMKAGVSVTATRYLGAVHNFPVLDQLADSAPSSAALQQIVGTLRTTTAKRDIS
ncbi:alpha/beta hydrolase [Agrobacterium cavarae]|uniref:alpha/beta hydrolase n=1 Tax=Agrobacterium cavarae TaxID=2528239 RepID=UPI0028AD494D|nr:alpha/beta hydrolase [Agrobacterium cavarae]